MTAADLGTFTARLVELGELFEANLTESKQLLYFQALADLEIGLVLAAVAAAAKTCTFMPKPAELRKLAVGDDDDHTERAWLAFKAATRGLGAYSSVLLRDPALADALVAIFGSWPQACAADLSPEMWSSTRKEFGRVYRVMRDRGLTGGRYLSGLSEQHNAGRLDWVRFVPMGLVDGLQVRQLSVVEAEVERTKLAAGVNEDGPEDARLLEEFSR